MELSVNLEFSESQDTFKYQCITPPNEVDFKTISSDLSYSKAIEFVVDLRERFPHPLLYVSVVCQFQAWKLKNNL